MDHPTGDDTGIVLDGLATSRDKLNLTFRGR
jgi:hypothetical protein